MGDIPFQQDAPIEDSQQGSAAAPLLVSSTTVLSQPAVASSGPLPYSPSHAHPPQQYGVPQHGFTSQLQMTQPQSPPRAGSFDMNVMANALPQPGYMPGPYGRGAQQRYHAVPGPGMTAQFAGQNAINIMSNQQYYPPQHAPMGHYYPGGVVVGQQAHPNPQYYYQHPQPAHFTTHPVPNQSQLVSSQYMQPVIHQADPRLATSHPAGQAANAGFTPEQTKEGRPSIVRGPPRKPRQSGHAIWIGNLPPKTDLMSLVHHVCKETDGLESLFLISKSNCAFANFKDEQACVAAQRKLHDSQFQSVRLVSRLRKSTVEGAAGVTAPTGPAASSAPSGAAQESEAAWEGEGAASEDTATVPTGEDDKTAGSAAAEGSPGPKDRFFILKSLTVEDLELSVRTGIWATQSHNEQILNKAFATSENVYLVFSANKSGEYFGYARMTSPINEDPAAAIQFAPSAPALSELELPKAIPTEATEFAPKGRIIDDSARGTIFWEVEREDRGSGGGSASGEDDAGGGGGDTGSAKSGDEGTGAESKTWGKPFRLEWLSTARLPFYRTRGLKNPWNSNRDVKIARDGTELLPAVGRRLISLFGQGPVNAGMMPTGPVPPPVGFPPMRPGPVPGPAYQPR
ncbi:zinc finger CCCH domain containing protein [Naviculisporaceae sp. PSN 640]